MILSGSCRRIDPPVRAPNVSPFFSLTGICSTPDNLIFDRVLDRDDLVQPRC